MFKWTFEDIPHFQNPTAEVSPLSARKSYVTGENEEATGWNAFVLCLNLGGAMKVSAWDMIRSFPIVEWVGK
jgi:hypothetical protein